MTEALDSWAGVFEVSNSMISNMIILRYVEVSDMMNWMHYDYGYRDHLSGVSWRLYMGSTR